MTPYAIVRLVHIFGALGLFVVIGSEWATHLVLARARTTGEVQRILPGFALAKLTGPFSGVFVVLPGFYLTYLIGGWVLPWVVIALPAVVALGILGGAVSGRRIRAIEAAVKGDDRPVTPEISALLHEPILWTGFAMRLTVVLGVIVLMVLKPGIPGSVGVMLVAVPLGFVLGGRLNSGTR
jgi:hypothetical protein